MKSKFVIGSLFMLILSFWQLQAQRNNCILLKNNWQLQNSELVKASGSEISSEKFKTKNWFNTSVPTTVLNALVKNAVYKDIFFSTNLDKIDKEQFRKPWWFRTQFELAPNQLNEVVKLEFDGIIYRANIWLNGKLVADSNKIFGAFRRFDVDITEAVNKKGTNILAVEIIPPRPGDFNVGFVDWNPRPPDESMGIWREVRVKSSGIVSISHPFVKTKLDLKDLKNAELTISCEVKNNSGKKLKADVCGSIENKKFSRQVTLEPNESKVVTFEPSEYKQLTIKSPRVWWTHELGKPELYKMEITGYINKKISDHTKTRFGIRDVRDYINEKGHRGYTLNGKKILIKGGGWTDDILLENNYDFVRNQVLYVKHMNMNMIRLEGFWGSNEDIYNICDEEGVLLMAGWSCQWEWENLVGKKTDNFGGIKEPDEIKLMSESWKDQVKWLRNHPSIMVWAYGSDLLPRPDLEIEYQKILKEDDPTRPYIASAKSHNSKITGKTAVKMLGPYDYVPPVYWWIDTANGGAYGFNTETGPGPQVPPIESIKKMIPKDSLWPVNSEWINHTSRGKFKRMDVYDEAMNKRYGEPNGVEEYCRIAQAVNYEAIRGMFESFVARRYKSTGVIQWMLNSAWPKLWWQLYDFYLMPNGAFYGAKKSCEPLHIMLDQSTDEVLVSNFEHETKTGLKAEAKIYDLNLNEKFSKQTDLSIKPDEVKSVFIIPKIDDLTNTYFLKLNIYGKNNQIISDNFYWLSTKPDLLDFPKTNWWITPIKEYADLSGLKKLPQTEIKATKQFSDKGDKTEFAVKIENPSKNIAFCLEIAILKEKEDTSILPVFMDDNYISLLPGESRTIKGYYFSKDAKNEKPRVRVIGWNTKEIMN